MVERQHLPSASARARLLRAPAAAGDSNPAGVRADEESDPLLQPAVPVDVRPVGAGNVPAREGADRQPRGGVRRGARVRVRPLPDRVAAAPAGAVVGVDAVRAARIPAVLRGRPMAKPRRRFHRVGGAESVVRLLPALFQSRHPFLYRLGTGLPESRMADARRGRLCARLRCTSDGSLCDPVSAAAPAWFRSAADRRDRTLLRRCVRLFHRGRKPACVGIRRARVAQT